jgi:hypothetical protein
MIIYRIRIQADILRIEYWDNLGNQYEEPLPAEAMVEDNPSPAAAMEELRAAANNSLAACSGMQSTKKNAHVNGRF